MFFRFLLIYLGCTLSALNVLGQSTDTLSVKVDLKLKKDILPLAVLIDSAIINSPTLKQYDELVTSSEFDYEAFKKSWAKEMSISFESKYGEYGSSFALDDLSLGYGGIVRVNVPLSLFVGRKSEIQAKYHAVQAMEYKRLEIVQMVKMEVINRYQTLIMSESALELRNEALVNARLNFDYAQLQFDSGEIGIEAYVKISDYKMNCELNFTQAKVDYWSAILTLEQIVGVKVIKA